jgi:hypothetical protein
MARAVSVVSLRDIRFPGIKFASDPVPILGRLLVDSGQCNAGVAYPAGGYRPHALLTRRWPMRPWRTAEG